MTSKTENLGECTSFGMCFNLNDYHFKTSRYSYSSIYMNSMKITCQKPTIDTQKLKRKEHKHNTEENHQTTRNRLKEENSEKSKKQPENQ